MRVGLYHRQVCANQSRSDPEQNVKTPYGQAPRLNAFPAHWWRWLHLSVVLAQASAGHMLGEELDRWCERLLPPSQPAPMTPTAFEERLDGIKRRLDQSHRLRSADRAYLEEGVGLPELSKTTERGQALAYGHALVCLLTLHQAIDYKLYSVGRFNSLIARYSVISDAQRAPLYARLRLYTLGLSPVPDAALNSAFTALAAHNKLAAVIADQEKRFVTRCLADHEGKNRFVAAGVLLAKRGLGRRDVAWTLHEVDRQVASSRGREREFWKYVRRVVAERNHAA